MNILKILFEDGFYNAPSLQKMDKNNTERLYELTGEIEAVTGSYVNPEVIKTVAVKYFLECYNTEEVIRVLDYFDFRVPSHEQRHCELSEKGEGNE